MNQATLNLRRDDFVLFSDGSSMFDAILDRLLIPESNWSKVYEIEFQLSCYDFVRARDESGHIISTAYEVKG